MTSTMSLSTSRTNVHYQEPWRPCCALAALGIPWSLVHAGKTIQEHRAAEPQGEVEIVNVSGMVEVSGWDKSEVEVSGTAGDGVERVDVTGTDNRTSIHVVARSNRSWGTDNEAHLIVRVPAKSAVMVTLVSADFKAHGVAGNLKVQTVSGGVSGEVGGDVCATTVSGDVRLTAKSAKGIEVKTISGDIQVTGGGGEVDVTTVSGSATVDLADITRGRFKSVSGDPRRRRAGIGARWADREPVGQRRRRLQVLGRAEARNSMCSPSAATSRIASGRSRSSRTTGRARGCWS